MAENDQTVANFEKTIDTGSGPGRITRRTALQVFGATGAVAIAHGAFGPVSPVAAAGAPTVSLAASNARIGTGMPLVGYNLAHYLPGSNTTAWVEYSRINAARFFCSPSGYAQDDTVDPGASVTDVASFDATKALLRANPTSDAYIRWDLLQQRFDNVVAGGTNHYRLSYMLQQVTSLGIAPIAEVYELRWGGPWNTLWQEWQKHYAMTFLMARNFGIVRYQFINEPDDARATLPNLATQDIYIQGLQIASDAIRCAIADVNRLDGTALKPIVIAPILTHSANSKGNYNLDASPGGDQRDDEVGWGQIALQNLRTDYHGDSVDYNIFDVYDTHQYGKAPSFYPYEIETIRSKMRQYTPGGVEIPIMYTEFNRQNTAAFAALPDDLNTPQIFQDIGSTWGDTLGADVEGMIAFKFENTVSTKGVPYKTGFYYVENTGVFNITGTTRAAEANRLFAKGFSGADKDLLRTDVVQGSTGFAGWVAHDRVNRSYHIWLPHASGDAAPYRLRLDLSKLPLNPGVSPGYTIEEVSATHGGDIVKIGSIPPNLVLNLVQPAGSVWLITIPDRRVVTESKVLVSGDATVVGGTSFGVNLGASPTLSVAYDTTGAADPQASYLQFAVPRVELRRSQSATLQLHAQPMSDGTPLTVSVFAVTDDTWTEAGITWLLAPHIDKSSGQPLGVGDTVFPAGKLTVEAAGGWCRLDVTDAVRHASADAIGFIILRTPQFDGDTTDNGRVATFDSLQSIAGASRPRLLLWR